MVKFEGMVDGAWAALGLIALGASLSGCSNRSFQFVHQGEQHLLLAPGVRKVALKEPSPECPGPDAILRTALTGRGAHYGRYGCYAQTGFVDLEPGLRLRVTTPVVPDGEALKNETVGGDAATGLIVRSNAMGWETVYYDVNGHGTGSAVELNFVSGEQVIEGERTELRAPLRSKLGLPSTAAHLRLYFLSRRSADDRDITLLASREPILTEDLAGRCGADGVTCLEALPGRSISPYALVSFNGKRVAAPLGASLSEVLRTEGVTDPKEELGHLRLRRNWQGRSRNVAFGAGDAAILSLPLNAGDEIRLDRR